MRTRDEQHKAWRRWLALLLSASALACGGNSKRSISESSSGGSAAGAAGSASDGGGGSSFGGDASAGGPAAEPVEPFEGTTEQYWTEVAERERQRYEECFGIVADYGMMGSNVVSAHYLIEAELARRLREMQPSIDAGRVRFDRQRAAECLHRLTTQSCAELRRDVALDPDGCVDDALVGLIESGGVCEQWLDCAGRDFICYGADPEEPRRCTPRSQPGESCDLIGCASGSECIEGGTSAQGLPTFTCVQRPPTGEGAPCGEGRCAEGLYCSQQGCRAYQADMPCTANLDCPTLQVCLVENGAPGRCGRARDEGSPCRGSSLENDCAFSLDCRVGEQGQPVCTSVWVKVGEPCRNTGARGGLVCIDGNCDILDAATQEGVCVPPDQLGEACYVGSCAPGLECTEAGCQPAPY